MNSLTPGTRPALHSCTIENKLKEALSSGNSRIVLMEWIHQSDSLKSVRSLACRFPRSAAVAFQANGTVLSFMEELLWRLHQVEPCFDFTITDIWRLEKEAVSLENIVTAFNASLASVRTPLVFFLDQTERITDPSLRNLLDLLLKHLPEPHQLVVSGAPLPSFLADSSAASRIQIEETGTDLAETECESFEAGTAESRLAEGNDALNRSDAQTVSCALINAHKTLIRSGRTWAMHAWVEFIEKEIPTFEPELAAALSAYHTATAHYEKAKPYLNTVFESAPAGSHIHTEAVLIEARGIRQTISCDSSNDQLDPRIFELEDLSTEEAYMWLIEKIQNLMLEDKWMKADELVQNLMTICDIAENERIRKWYERLMVSISYHYGDLNDAIAYYEKSLDLPEEDQVIVQESNVTPYAAKAYFTTGNVEKGLALLTEAIQKLKQEGRIQELQSHYMALGKLYFLESVRLQETESEKYLALSADAFHLSSVYGKLVCPSEENLRRLKEYDNLYTFMRGNASPDTRQELFDLLSQTTAPFNIFLLNAFALDALKNGDDQQAFYYGMYAIEVGEMSKQKWETALAYGLTALAAHRSKTSGQTHFLTRRFFDICKKSGARYFLHIPQLMEPLLEFAKTMAYDPIHISEIEDYLSSSVI